jgi:serine protease
VTSSIVSESGVSVGSSVGASNLYASGNLATTTASVTGLPSNGSTVYVRLQSQINGVWQFTDYTYTAVSPTKAAITSPAPNSVLAGTSVNFTWGGGFQVSQYVVYAGTTPGGFDVVNSGTLASSASSFAATIPATGANVYVTLWSFVSGAWQNNAYVYTASGTPATKGVISTPPPNSTLSSSNVTFSWTGSGSANYQVFVGTSPGALDIANSGPLPSTTSTYQTTVPASGANVYVRLWSFLNGTWLFNDYVYTASGTASLGSMTAPAPNSTLTGTSVLFTWVGNGPATYQVFIGTAPGTLNIANSGPLASSVNSYLATVPATGTTVYVRLYSFINNTWQFVDYTYTAFQ